MLDGDIGECIICGIGISPKVKHYADKEGNLVCEECDHNFKTRFKEVRGK